MQTSEFPLYLCKGKYEATGDGNTMLGAGGFSNVWRGTNNYDKTFVAIKIMRVKVHNNPKLLQQMEAEIELMKHLDHENCLRLYDTDIHPLNGTLVLILEYCNRGDLSKYIAEQKSDDKSKPPHLTISDAVYFFKQLSAGYGHLRKQNIIHRDIKPENLLLTRRDPTFKGDKAEDLILKIADFGLAREVGDDVAMTQCGTKGFIAPEIMTGGGYTYKADMWAIGCTLYYSLTGQRINDTLIEFGVVTDDTVKSLPEEAIKLLDGLLQMVPWNRLSYEEFTHSPFFSQQIEEKRKSAKTLAQVPHKRRSSSRTVNLSPRARDSSSPSTSDANPTRKKSSHWRRPLDPRKEAFFTPMAHSDRWNCAFALFRISKSLEDERVRSPADLIVIYVTLIEAFVQLKKVSPALESNQQSALLETKDRLYNLQVRAKGEYDLDAPTNTPQDILIGEAISRCRAGVELETDDLKASEALSPSQRTTRYEIARTRYLEARNCLNFVLFFLTEEGTETQEGSSLAAATPQRVLTHMVSHITQRIEFLSQKLNPQL